MPSSLCALAGPIPIQIKQSGSEQEECEDVLLARRRLARRPPLSAIKCKFNVEVKHTFEF